MKSRAGAGMGFIVLLGGLLYWFLVFPPGQDHGTQIQMAFGNVSGDTVDDLVLDSLAKVKEGFTAVRFSPFAPDFHLHSSYSEWADEAVRRVGAVREAVGMGIDLCVEIHRRLDPAEAIVLGRGIEPYRPYFYEDPIRPDNLDAMAEVARKINIPIATGERIHTIYEFEMLLTRNAVQYVRPDVCMCGGITHGKKIAALAEAHHVGVVPHNPLSPVSTAACIQLAACIPNFALQEYPTGEDKPPKSEIVKSTLKCEDGFLILPDAPGIGVELAEGAMEKYPFVSRGRATRLNVDGSVMDQ